MADVVYSWSHQLESVSADIEDVSRLLRQMSPETPACTAQTVRQVLQNGEILVARDLHTVLHQRPAIVGMATLIPTRKLNGFEGLVETVVVDDRYRGFGIGRRLMELLIERARSYGITHLNLTSHPRREAANVLYQRLGFERRETNVYRLALR